MKQRSQGYPASVDAYISQQPDHIKVVLNEIRHAINSAAPGATEKISYGMPAFTLNGILVYFAAFKNHIGFFPTSSGIEAFRDELSPYSISKGTVRFKYDKPVPLNLIREIVRFRVGENRAKTKSG